jgi:prophage maintenance system killer protein
MDVFLRLNDQSLGEEEDEKYDFVQGIASGTIPFLEVSTWIAQRLRST